MKRELLRILVAACVILLAVPIVIAMVGCQQPTTSVSPQVIDQSLPTPATTDQIQQAPGHEIRINVFNHPEPASAYDSTDEGDDEGDDTDDESDGAEPSMLEGAIASASGSGTHRGGHSQGGVNINVTTGDMTPGQTGTATASSSANPTSSQTHTLSPVQDVKPEFTTSVAIPIGLPGSAPYASANAAGSGGQLSNPTNSATQSPQVVYLKIPADKAAAAIPLFDKILEFLSLGKTPQVTSTQGE